MKKLTIATTSLLVAALSVPTIASASTITVKNGDTLYSIAKNNHISLDKLKSINNLKTNTIFSGQKLFTSQTSSTSTSTVKKEYRTVTGASWLNVRSGAGNNYNIVTTIKKGAKVEILSTKSGWYYISVNGKKGYSYSSYFSDPTYETVKSSSGTSSLTTTYTVSPGDTLWSIASKHNISVSTLKSLNKLTSETIYKGQKLIVKGSAQTSSPTTDTPTNTSTPSTTSYKVQKGDTLFKIASKFNLSVSNLKKLNKLSSDVIYVGQSLKVSGTNPQTKSLFNRPADGVISSGFKARWGSFHYGIDFAKSGNVQVKAAADGVVSRSYTSDSYGEVVFIKHTINGQNYETVYAHMRSGSRAVQVGDKVKSGQFLGWMGSTGNSTGQHVHFELHKGEWTYDKANAVDPTPYLNL
ncbi:LysM peptidoglycan-binding domain-containing protein [Bacillus mexicanus]|uniref:LysM peptidoglycan-binding domain-containing protein n=1 Tax=Bacillus mexicanus TaxID=2834415 RepID=UPI003D20016A